MTVANGILDASALSELSAVLVDVREIAALSSSSDNTATFAAALAAAAAGGRPGIFIPQGRWPGNITPLANNLAIIGGGKPYYDGTTLVGGAIIEGAIFLSGRSGIKVAHLGLDQSGLANTVIDGINAGIANASRLDYYFHDLMFLGRGYAAGDSRHAIVAQCGVGMRAERITSVKYGHGVAVRVSQGHVRDIRVIDNELSAVIFKSDNQSGGANDCIDGSAEGIVATCSAASMSAMVCVQSLSTSATYATRNIRISNVYSQGSSSHGVRIEATNSGVVNDVHVSDFQVVENTAAQAVAVLGAGCTNILLSDGLVISSAGNSYENIGGPVVLVSGCRSVTPFSGDFVGSFGNLAQGTTFYGGNKKDKGAIRVGHPDPASGDGSVRLYQYNGTLNTYRAWDMRSLSQGVQLRGAAVDAAIGGETFTVNGFRIDSTGRMGLGGTAASPTTPSALLTLAAGAAAVGQAPLKLTAGANLTTPENGAFEYDGTNLYFTTGGVRKTVTLI